MKKIVLLSVIASTMIMAGGDFSSAVEPVVEVPEVVVATPSPFYVGLAYGFMSEDYTRSVDGVKDAGRSFDEDFSSIMLQAGYTFNPYVAVEGRYWASIDDTNTAAGNVDAPDAWGMYVKPMYPVTDKFDVYGLLGYAYTDTNIIKIDGFSWGLGASYSFMDNVSIFVDYVSLYDDDDNSFVNTSSQIVKKDFDIDSVNVGITYNF